MKTLAFTLVAVSFALVTGCTSNVTGTQPTAGEAKAEATDGGATKTADGVKSGSSDACETAIDWSHTNADSCSVCVQTNCAQEIRALDDVASSCENQYAAAFACSSCNCADNAITNKRLCQEPFDAYLACMTGKCESGCK